MNASRSRWNFLASPTLQGVAHIATAAAAIFAAIGLFLTASQLRISADQGKQQALLEREMSANASWERYMELASDHPEFAGGLPYPTLSVDRKTSYLWFVERMLFAGEQVLSLDPTDKQWLLAIYIEARIHRSYIENGDFLNESICTYTSDLRRSLAQAFLSSDAIFSRRLTQRDRECTAAGYRD